MSGKAQNMVALGATLGVTAATKKAVDAVWRLGSGGKTPPTDPEDPSVQMREAVVWAVLSGAAVSVVRLLLARRFARDARRQNAVAQVVPGVAPAEDTSASTVSPGTVV